MRRAAAGWSAPPPPGRRPAPWAERRSWASPARWPACCGASTTTGSTLDERTVVILDEVGMTEDAHLVALTARIEAAGAKLVLVGDHHQLGAVGPGGALAALVRPPPRRRPPPQREPPPARPGRASGPRRSCATATSPRRSPGTRARAASTLPPTGTSPCSRPWTPGRPTWRPDTRPACTPGGGPTWPPSTSGPGRGWRPPVGCPDRSWSAPAAAATGPATASSPWPPARTAGWSPPSGPSSRPSIWPADARRCGPTTASTCTLERGRSRRRPPRVRVRHHRPPLPRVDHRAGPPLRRRRGPGTGLRGHVPGPGVHPRLDRGRRPGPGRGRPAPGLVHPAYAPPGPSTPACPDAGRPYEKLGPAL